MEDHMRQEALPHQDRQQSSGDPAERIRFRRPKVHQELHLANQKSSKGDPMEQASCLKARSYEQERYLQYRLRVLPIQLENAYRKVESLQREARRLGMEDIIREIRP